MPTITICGSMQFVDQMQKLANELRTFGFDVYLPASNKKSEDFQDKIKHDFIRKHYNHIKRSSGILIVNLPKKKMAGYIGANSLIEMGFAHVLNKDIFLINPASSSNFGYDEIMAMQPIILEGNLKKLRRHYENLPQSLVASQNALKIDAVDAAFRLFGIRNNWTGLNVDSGISEQPLTLDETYQGAINRLKNLEKAVGNQKFEYLVAIESGNHEYKGTLYGLSVVAIKDKNGKLSIGISWDPSVPKEFLELVPSKYPDFGVLVQKEYGVQEKDPYIYLSGGKFSRFDFLRDAVVRALLSK